MNENELLYAMALTRIPTIGNTWALTLYQAAGSATTLFENHKEDNPIISLASYQIFLESGISHLYDFQIM